MTAVLAVSATVAAMFALGVHVLPTADDFANCNQIQSSSGAIGYTKHMYGTWTGRVFSTASLGLALRSYSAFPWVSALLGACFCSIGVLLVRAFRQPGELRGSVGDSEDPWIIALLATIGLTFGLGGFLAECVFWPTGGIVYVFPWAVSLGWICALGTCSDRIVTPIQYTLWFVFSALVGTTHEQIAPVLLCSIGANVLVERRGEPSSSRRRLLVIGALGVVVGMVILFAAPGNFVRAKHSATALQLDLLRLAKNYALLLLQGARISKAAVLWGAITGAVLALVRVQPLEERAIRRGCIAVLLIVAAACSTLAPMVLVRDFAAPRTFFFFASLMFAGALLATDAAVTYARSALTAAADRRAGRLGVAASMLLAVSWSFWVVGEIRLASHYRADLMVRHLLLCDPALSGRDVVVAPILHSPPESIHFNDLSADPTHWINIEVAKFYGLRSVRLAQE